MLSRTLRLLAAPTAALRLLAAPTAALCLLAPLAVDALPSSAQPGRSHAQVSAHAARGCPRADAPPSSTLAMIRRATICLINEQRAADGLPALRTSPQLSRAAARHTQDMVSHAYFAHTSPTGDNVVTRAELVGYLRGALSWTVGEDIAWGTGPRATPQAIVAGWMRSPPHRANILSSRYHDIGIGVARGLPVPGAGASAASATYTSDFGARG